MKKTLHLILAAAMTFNMTAKTAITVTPASDSRITYVGRTLTEGDNVTFDWTGTEIRLRFTGDRLDVTLSDTDLNYFNLWLDGPVTGEADKIIPSRGSDTTVTLITRADLTARYGRKIPTEHTVILKKRTEGEQGKTTFHSFTTSGTLLQASPVRERIIEFIGDSYTCGYGSENSVATDPFKKETENQNKAYDAIVSRYFDADHIVIAHSGMGISRNYNDKLKGYHMPDRYLNVFDDGYEQNEATPKWDPDSFAHPDITVIFLGANDFSVSRQPSLAQFKANYTRLLQTIKGFYGESHPILCVATHNDPMIATYVKAAVDECNMKDVTYTAITPYIRASDELGASFHPNYTAQRKAAFQLIPYIATLTGWGLQDRPVE
jgi:lysophospholipase L1-like esterase